MTDAHIFQILGIFYLAIAIGIFLNPDYYRKMVTDFMTNPPVTYLGGIAALIIGYILIRYHNIWAADWSVLITIIGWIAFIKGLLLIVLPKAAMNISSHFTAMTKFLKTWAIIALVLGVLFCWLGFVR